MTKAEYIARGIGKCQYDSSVIDQVRTLYSMGLSSRQIAQQLAIGKSRIAQWCRDIARTTSEANQLRFPFSNSSHWRTCRGQARKLMERHLKRKLARNEHVHHINGDYTDNRLMNLQVMDGREHNRLHNLGLIPERI